MNILKRIKFRNGFELDLSKPLNVIYGDNERGKSTLLNLVSELNRNIFMIKKVSNLKELDGDVVYELNPEFFEIEANHLFINQTDEIILITDAPKTIHSKILDNIKRKLKIYHWSQSAIYTMPITYFFRDENTLSLSEARLDLLKSDSKTLNNHLILLDDIVSLFSESQREQFISILEGLSNLNQIILTTNKYDFGREKNFSKIVLSSDFTNYFYEEIFPRIYKEDIITDEEIYDEFLNSVESIENY